jgi:cytochrome c oxidase subunit 3
MSAVTTSFPNAAAAWDLPSRGKVAMAGLIIAEAAIFTIFVVAYLFYLGKSVTGPTPREVLETPIFYTICLLSSSLTIHFAAKCLERGIGFAFLGLWLLTIALGRPTCLEPHITRLSACTRFTSPQVSLCS